MPHHAIHLPVLIAILQVPNIITHLVLVASDYYTIVVLLRKKLSNTALNFPQSRILSRPCYLKESLELGREYKTSETLPSDRLRYTWHSILHLNQ